jgi:signal transduction histidine kinase
VFLSSLELQPANTPSRQHLVNLLNEAQRRALAPLNAVIVANERTARARDAAADAGSRHALAAALAAGLVALAGGLGFVWYAVRLLRRVNRQNEALLELDRMKDEFVASVSHELRTPLTSISGYLELLVDDDNGGLTEDQRHYLSVVQRNSERLLHLVGDLLFVARLTGSTLELDRTEIDLTPLVLQSIEAARPVAEERSLELELVADDEATVDGDRARLGQVIDNLLSNALKFTPPGGRVTVTIERGNDSVHMAVADTGMGISEADQEHLFERFFRSSNAITQAIQGTGLGLSIVGALVEAHGGTIEIASEIGKGTTFTVVLPAAQPAETLVA